MPKAVNRRPIGNFFIKKSLQLRLIKNILLSALISTVVASSTLFLVYFWRFKTVVVYQLDKSTQDLARESILSIILPALLISACISLLLAFGIGLYSSRKYAVPIYKIERWLSLLLQGKLGATLQFREKEEMKELSDKCNNLGVELQKTFHEIRLKVQHLKDQNIAPEITADIDNIINRMEFESDPIKVSTSMYSVEKTGKDGKGQS
jgi:methyl-accepting chemotaxis protein